MKSDERCERDMASVPHEVLHALAGMSGYDRMLEIDRIAAAYGVGHAWIEQQIAGSPQPSSPAQDPNNFAPSSKEAPPLPTTPSILNTQSFRFQYDPSEQAAERRQSVSQAILCPACGVALGIPSVRPIKVTCPQCLQESIFQS